MPRLDVKAHLKQGPFLLDGGMGSQLIARKIHVDTCNDCLCFEAPDQIEQIHRDYLQAGSDAVITNSFGASEIMLSRHGTSHQSFVINKTAAQIARRAAGDEKVVLGDIGPCGDLLAPLGIVSPKSLKKAFQVQVEGLLTGGVDGLIVETMTALEEASIAVEVATSLSDNRPVLASMAFDHTTQGFHTMMGVDVHTAVFTLVSLGVTAVGFNCGTATLDEYEQLGEQFVRAVRDTQTDTIVYAEPNAGRPELINGQAVYKVSPETFAETLSVLYDLGIHILGGCCGTGPEHIAAVTRHLKSYKT